MPHEVCAIVLIYCCTLSFVTQNLKLTTVMKLMLGLHYVRRYGVNRIIRMAYNEHAA